MSQYPENKYDLLWNDFMRVADQLKGERHMLFILHANLDVLQCNVQHCSVCC